MKLFTLFFSIVLLSLPLLAERIIVTKTAHKSNLRSINAKLKSLQVKMYIQKSPNYYFIYTKEYATNTQAKAQLRKIKTLFPYAKIAKEKRKEEKTHRQENTPSTRTQEETNFIVGFGVGNSSVSGYSGNSISFNNTATSYSFKAGAFLQPNLLVALAYATTTVEKTSISNSYAKVDYYYYFTKKANIYAGGLLGYSRLKMDYKESVPSGSALYGAEIGVSYDLFGYIPLSLAYQSVLLGHTITFTSDTQTVDIHTNLQSTLMLGVAYRF